jgi:hypothetical protein
MADVGVGQPEIAVPALRAQHDQVGLDELGHVHAGRLRGDTGRRRQLAGGQVLPAHQRRQHAGACRVADHRGDLREARLGRGHRLDSFQKNARTQR